LRRPKKGHKRGILEHTDRLIFLAAILLVSAFSFEIRHLIYSYNGSPRRDILCPKVSKVCKEINRTKTILCYETGHSHKKRLEDGQRKDVLPGMPCFHIFVSQVRRKARKDGSRRMKKIVLKVSSEKELRTLFREAKKEKIACETHSRTLA